MTPLVGYTRALATDRGTADVAALKQAGAKTVFADVAGVDPRRRPGLEACLAQLAEGDVLIVTSAARLSHGVSHFLTTVSALDARGVVFRSLAEPALSTDLVPVETAAVVSALDGLQRRLVGLRTREGMAAAAVAGRRPGRPTVMTSELRAVASELRAEGRSFAQVARVLGVSASAVQRALAPAGHD